MANQNATVSRFWKDRNDYLIKMSKQIYFMMAILVLGLGFLSYKLTYGFFVDTETSAGNAFIASTTFGTPTPTPSGSPSPTPEPFVDEVVSVTGTFGHCCSDLSSDPTVAAPLVTGAPDSPPDTDFIQLSDNTVMVLKFVDNKAVDGSGADIRIHVYDALFPASAKIEISPDGVTYTEASASQPDTANFDIDLTPLSLSEVKFIRITDLVGDVEFPSLGYDLDAITALNSAAP